MFLKRKIIWFRILKKLEALYKIRENRKETGMPCSMLLLVRLHFARRISRRDMWRDMRQLLPMKKMLMEIPVRT